jgi:hypothetical protein
MENALFTYSTTQKDLDPNPRKICTFYTTPNNQKGATFVGTQNEKKNEAKNAVSSFLKLLQSSFPVRTPLSLLLVFILFLCFKKTTLYS